MYGPTSRCSPACSPPPHSVFSHVSASPHPSLALPVLLPFCALWDPGWTVPFPGSLRLPSPPQASGCPSLSAISIHPLIDSRYLLNACHIPG